MRVQIIGKGRVGYSLYLFLKDRGFDVEIFSRREGGRILEDGDILFFAVKDREIREVAENFSNLNFSVFCHLSGALSSDILPTKKERASFHPLQAFSRADPKLWEGITVIAEGTEGALNVLEEFSERLSLKMKKIQKDKKVIYHAAAVMLSNLIYVPLLGAERLFSEIGIDREDYGKLLRTSVENFLNYGKGGITGPIFRGDWETVELHKKNLKGIEGEIYTKLSELLVKLL
jgi:Uncharacterized conserved protein